MHSAVSTNSQQDQPLSETRRQKYADDDSFDLLAFFKAMLRTWKTWFMAMVLVTITFASYQAINYSSSKDAAPYTKIIRLSFKGADQDQYPNGTSFRIQDIIAPAVLNAVYTSLDLAASGISLADIKNALTIAPYTPYYNEINTKYEELLGSKRLTFADIEDLQKRKKTELAQSAMGLVKLSFRNDLGLKEEQVVDLMNAIPQEWARQAATDKGVLKMNVPLASANSIQKQLFEKSDYLVLNDLFQEKTRSLQNNIDTLQKLEGAAAARDPKTGWNLADLEKNLLSFRVYVVDKLMAPIRALGLTQDANSVSLYYQEKRALLSEETNRLEDEAKVLKTALESYKNKAMQSPGDQGAQGSGNFMQPMDGQAMETFINLVRQDTVEKYRQDLIERWVDVNDKLAFANSSLREVERLLATINSNNSDDPKNASDPKTVALRDKYLGRIKSELDGLLDTLIGYYDICQRIYEQISTETLGSTGYLYKEAHEGALRADIDFSIKRVILAYMALLIGVSILVIAMAMIRNALKERVQANLNR